MERLTETSLQFLHIQAVGGLVLVAAAVLAVVWANSRWADTYQELLHAHFSVAFGRLHLEMGLQHAINDGLMTVFFFLVGMEIKREVLVGELRDRKTALLPAFAALGGMVVPAAIYLAFQSGKPAANGWGIPMATDIAFAIGLLALLGGRIPSGLKVFLLALAIADDLGAVLVIAVFYTEQISFLPLALAGVGFLGVTVMQRVGVRPIPPYVVAGLLIWLAMYHSGIHPTVAGVLLGLLTPMASWLPYPQVVGKVRFWSRELDVSIADPPDRERRWQALRSLAEVQQDAMSPLARLETGLHLWVAYVIVPVFALANAGVAFSLGSSGDSQTASVTLAVAGALLIGKPVGIFLFSLLAVKSGLARLPARVGWVHVLGAGMLGGIGFTVSLFIAALSFDDPATLDAAKTGVLAGSTAAAILGLGVLWLVSRRQPSPLATDHARVGDH
ncbi:MAG: Na+/H+ antiporter NhaA [SAR202 cluster bacterium]|nr:Na+/H+ antiporter NhaA [SAR202 cluster bacterium]